MQLGCGGINWSLFKHHIYVVNNVTLFVAEQVDEAEARFKLFIGTIEVSDKRGNFCDLKPNWNISCPFYPGNALSLLLYVFKTQLQTNIK